MKWLVKSVWKSARAVRDWPGMVTICRFSPFKNGESRGKWRDRGGSNGKNVADKIRAIWAEDVG